MKATAPHVSDALRLISRAYFKDAKPAPPKLKGDVPKTRRKSKKLTQELSAVSALFEQVKQARQGKFKPDLGELNFIELKDGSIVPKVRVKY